MDQTLLNFLQKRQEKGNSTYTHVSQIRPIGKYNITRKDEEEFWDIYCDILYKNQNMISGLAEKPNNYLPVISDVDIKLEYKKDVHKLNKKLYNETHVKQVIMIYQKHIKNITRQYKPEYGICVLLEKKYPTIDNENIKHGFHLHFPYCFMSKIDQDIHLIPRVREDVENKNLFSDIGILDSSSVIDKSSTSKHWLLYGSRKEEKLQSYIVSHIFDDTCNEITSEDAFKNYNLKNVYGEPIEMTKKYEYYYPRLLSINPYEREVVFLRGDLNIITKKHLVKAKDSKVVYEELSAIEGIKKARELMPLISPERANDYDDWLDIGFILFNISVGTEEGLDLWINFSMKTTKGNFSESSCHYYWNKMEIRNKALGTLNFYAKKDSPEEYKKLKEKENKELFKDSLDGGHNDLAKWLFNRYQGDFKCACNEKNVWYRFEGHRWVYDKKGITLSKKISVDLLEEFKRMKSTMIHEMADDDSSLAEISGNPLLKKVDKIICNLKSAPFKKHVMAEATEFFYDPNFMKRLDTDVNLIGFNNGVLDLNEKRFRPGKPEDYISLTTRYDYVEHNADDMEVIEVLDHFSKVFPDEELRVYFMEYAANLLKGGNNIKTFLNLTGKADGGKSATIDLLTLVLGDYMKTLPTSLITGKRTQSSQATPELANIKGVRFAVFNEPSGKDVINEGILKELSGNDSIYVRGLFKEPEEIKPMFKLALISNKLPKLPASDTGVWSRIRVLPHLALFPKDQTLVPKTIEEQYRQKIFPRDPLFNEKLPRFKSAMMWLMVQKWYKIDAFGREEEPELVKSATAEYRKNNDIFLQFIMERLIRDPYNEKAQLSVVELYNAFKTWFTDSYPNLMNQMPSKEELKEDFVNKWGELSQNHKWKGYRIRTLEDDEREGAVLVLRENDLASSKEEEEDFKEHEESKVEEDTEEEDSDSDSEADDSDSDADSDSDSEAEEDEDDNIIIRKK